jgi:hypothetical protein
MRVAEIVCAVALLGWGGLMLRGATRLEIGWEASGPGPGFFPFWLAMGLTLCGISVLIQALRAPAPSPPRAFLAAAARWPLVKLLAPMLGAVLVMELAGFYVAAALYLAVSARLLGRHTWALVLAISVLFPVLTWLVFERWFLVPLPKGYLGRYLPF